jgi:hypothetical protein
VLDGKVSFDEVFIRITLSNTFTPKAIPFIGGI